MRDSEREELRLLEREVAPDEEMMSGERSGETATMVDATVLAGAIHSAVTEKKKREIEKTNFR